MNTNFTTGKDLTKSAPRSPKVLIGGFAIVARTIDKCRAVLWGNVGEYHFDCPLDRSFLDFNGIKGDDFKKYVSEGHSDEEIVAWVRANGKPTTDADIAAWTKKVISNNYADQPEKKPWLEGENKRLGLDKDGTLFDYLEADDAASFKSLKM